MIQKYLPIFILLCLQLSALAQTQLPNADMEQWTIAMNGTDSLKGWSSSNSIVIPPVQSLYQEKNAWEGKYAANVVTAPFGFVGYSTIGVLVNGEATFHYGGGGGGANVDYAAGGGTPIAVKPSGLTGYYRFETLAPGDQALAKIYLTATNKTTGKRDTVGSGQLIFPVTSTYTPFIIPIEDYLPGLNPDTILTIFYSSDPLNVAPIGVWSNLYLDSLNLIYQTTSTKDHALPNAISLAPNPTSDQFTLFHPRCTDGTFDMYSIAGQFMCSGKLAEDALATTVNVQHIPEGQYWIRIFQKKTSSFLRIAIIH